MGIEKLLRGVAKFREYSKPEVLKLLQSVTQNPNPFALFISCMDPRLTPLRFTGSQLGDMFIVRNAGNMIPQAAYYGATGFESVCSAETAALDLVVKRCKLKHVVVCGHSDCKAMNRLYNLNEDPKIIDNTSALDKWICHHGCLSLLKLSERLKLGKEHQLIFESADKSFCLNALIDPEDRYDQRDKLSQINTLQQAEHMATHVADALKNGELNVHAFWFEIGTGDMHVFSKHNKRYMLINQSNVEQLIDEMKQ